jgi:predicted nucleotidyltransferase component of viral defense system
MIEWLQLSDDRKRQILQQASAATGLPAHAIEKDWWVTLSLQALFSTKWKDNLVFKGGTSLSKAWRLIERFSYPK